MAFDAGMMSAVVYEMNLEAADAKIERVLQPSKDLIVLQLHSGRATKRLMISASSNNPRINITELTFENPTEPPMFCMLLRKHLVGARISEVRQFGFERALEIVVDGYDELGYPSKKYIIVEIMGKYSNLILCDGDYKIIAPLRIVEMSINQKRPILPGMGYELPPPQDKLDPLKAERAEFIRLYENTELPPDKFIQTKYLGFSQLVAREIAFRAGGRSPAALWEAFDYAVGIIKTKSYTPTLIRRKELKDGVVIPGKPLDYCYLPISQYGGSAIVETLPDFGTLLDTFFEEKEKTERLQQRAADIFRLLTNAETRLKKKTALQRRDIADCAEKEKYRRYGDLIISNIYRIERGMTSATLTDWSEDPPVDVSVPLDARLSPAANAQRWYKRYAKAKTAEVELAKQIEISERELEYIHTVFDALSRAETDSDITDIRRELYESGYASKMKNYVATKPQKPKPMLFETTGGYEVLIGKNNAQNDYITTRLAEPDDIWFHVKNSPGSHVVIRTGGDTPPDEDLTECAVLAAYFSKEREGENVEVDYTEIRYVKKPNGSKPGYVTYKRNKTAIVTPDAELAKRLRKN
ncbi:MAG: fibronectin-binding domain-containing protein [Clostridiales bacterium]|nr:fibronectin-binding domain-containing protein [Clostridiales bacterium]